MRRRTRRDESEAALVGEIARIGRRLLSHRAVPAGTPPPGTVWQSALAVFAEPLATRRGVDPAPGAEICPGLKLFHDAGAGSIFSWSQIIGAFGAPAAPGLSLTCYGFTGSFLSLVVDMPPEGLAEIGPGRTVRIAVTAAPTRPLTCFLRLNLAYGNSSETLHETLVLSDGTRCAEFDLGGLAIAPGACRTGWLDVILHAPRMCRVDIARLSIAIARPGAGARQ